MISNLLIIGHTFPEPSTTAAGSRMMQLISVFQHQGYKIYFGCSAKVTPNTVDMEKWGIIPTTIHLNDASFDSYLREINPTIVLFDRYITEEQFGWRVTKHCPNALKILDTEDLHFLRKAREKAFKAVGNLDNVDLYTETAIRELTSIMRCDVSLIISEYEMGILTSNFNISESILLYLPFMVSTLNLQHTYPSFETRNGFLTVGNLLHSPNLDSVIHLKKDIWPKIREQLPQASLSIYGQYAPQQVKEFHDVKSGFLVKGWAPSIEKIMCQARVCLAPIRFGAGLKGKLLDAMIYDTPAITTTLGAEGMYGDFNDAGAIADNTEEFIQLSVRLYSNKNIWENAQQKGFAVLKQRFDKTKFSEELILKISTTLDNLDSHRKTNFISQILNHNSLNSSKYMSKWIEEKNKP